MAIPDTGYELGPSESQAQRFFDIKDDIESLIRSCQYDAARDLCSDQLAVPRSFAPFVWQYYEALSLQLRGLGRADIERAVTLLKLAAEQAADVIASSDSGSDESVDVEVWQNTRCTDLPDLASDLAWIFYCLCCVRLGWTREAENTLGEIIEGSTLSPQWEPRLLPTAWFGLALVALQKVETMLNESCTEQNATNIVGGASVVFQSALTLDPSSADLAFRHACFLELIRQHDRALSEYDRAIALSPEDAHFYHARGQCRVECDNVDGGVSDLRKAGTLHPPLKRRVLLEAGMALRQAGRLHEACSEIEDALMETDGDGKDECKNTVHDATVLCALGMMYLKLGETHLAMSDFDAALKNGNGDNESNGMLCQTSEESAEGLEAVRAQALVGKGVVFQKREQYRESIDAFTEALRFIENNARTLCLRGYSHYLSNNLENAVTDLNMAINLVQEKRQAPSVALTLGGPVSALFPEEDDGDVEPTARQYRSLVRLAQGRFTEALDEHEWCVKASPRDPAVYYNRGVARLTVATAAAHPIIGLDAALSDFDMALQMNPDLAGGYAMRGEVYMTMSRADTSGNEEKLQQRAMHDLDECLRRDSEHMVGLLKKGFALLYLGDVSTAAELGRKAVSVAARGFDDGGHDNMKPPLEPTLLLAHCCVQSGQLDHAIKHCEDIIKSYEGILSASAHHLCGTAHSLAKNHHKAIKHLHAAVAADPTNVDYELDYCRELAESGQPQESILKVTTVIHKLEEKGGSSMVLVARAHFTRARILNLQERYEEALVDLDTSIHLDPRKDEYYAARGTTNAGLCRWEEAHKDMSTAVTMNPGNAEYVVMRAKLLDDVGCKDMAVRDLIRGTEITMDEVIKATSDLQNTLKRQTNQHRI